MADVIKQDDMAIPLPDELNKAIKQFEDAIREKHKRTSKKKTPGNKVKQKSGFDYVEAGEMRNALDSEYPIWSWKPAGETPVIKIMNWIMVSGVLEIIESGGIKRSFFSPGAAQIQIKKDGDPNNFKDILSISNTIKSANIDGFKKAINMLTGLFDDVYRNVKEEPADDKQTSQILELVDKVNDERYSLDAIQKKYGDLNEITSSQADTIICILKNKL